MVTGCAENDLCDNREVDMPNENLNYSLALNLQAKVMIVSVSVLGSLSPIPTSVHTSTLTAGSVCLN